MACLTDSIPWRGDFEQKLVYAPEKRPGFVAWVTAFPYGDGSIGISFDETLEAMRRVGASLPFELRESALGGIAATPSARRYCPGCGR